MVYAVVERASTFFNCAAFSSALYPSKTAASAARISDVWEEKKKGLKLRYGAQPSYLVTFFFDVRHDMKGSP